MPSATQENNKRIAKNTIALYTRQILVMLVNLYTSRVVLSALGVDDYGIYNVVGGVVIMLSFFNSSMAIATQKDLNYEMGKGHDSELPKIFSVSFISFCLLAVLMVLIAETGGLWFVLHKLVIPAERMHASLWVFQFSIATFVINMLAVPYNAAIIAHERMTAFAYISILEVVNKLLIAYLIMISPIDKLVFYGLLMCANALIIRNVYSLYSRKHFHECRITWTFDKEIFKRLFGFSGWMLLGTTSHVFTTQGVNMLINMFFGPALNAARAISVQIYNAINTLATNFIMATRPQVVKSFAKGDYDYMYKLVFSSSKLAFLLLFVVSLPIIMQTDYILALWLKTVPPSTALFVQLTLVDLLIACSFSPIASLSQASGKIRNYQLIISIGFLLILVSTWILYKLGFPVYYTFIAYIVFDLLGLFGRIFELKFSQDFPVAKYLLHVFCPVSIGFVVVIIGGYLIRILLHPTGDIGYLCLNTLIYLMFGSVLGWLIVLNRGEKSFVLRMINRKKQQELT